MLVFVNKYILFFLMTRFVAPKRWTNVHRVEDPPLMMKQLVQAVCGGMRWLETRMLGEHLSTRAVEHGLRANKAERNALGASKRFELSRTNLSSRPRHGQIISKNVRHVRKTTRSSSSQKIAVSKSHLPEVPIDVQPFFANTLSKECDRGRHLLGRFHHHECDNFNDTHAKIKVKSTMRKKEEVDVSADDGKCLTVSASSSALQFQVYSQRLVTYDVLDCTFGSGYHSGAILKNGEPYTRVVAIDIDSATSIFAKRIISEFGNNRFRFFCSRMSHILSMFGESSFDAVIIDPGPSMTQVMDPARGFSLSDDLHIVDGEHSFDLRCGSDCGMDALHFLNTVPQHTLAQMLTSYKMLTTQQSMKLARVIRVARPLSSSTSLLRAVQNACNHLPEEGWQSQNSRRRSPMSLNFFISLRGIINHEMYELREVLNNALLVLRPGGRVVIFSRVSWEESIIKNVIADHPYASLSYTEIIEARDVQEYGHVRHTKLWVVERTKQSNNTNKSRSLSTDEVHESTLRWLSGAFAGQSHGFPAYNTTFIDVDESEKRTIKRNEQLPPLDDVHSIKK